MFVTFISTYVFSRSISQTFRSFNQTAKEIAGGNFSSRIEPNSFSTETIELAASLNYMAEELEKLEDLRKDFIANISHDFRSPLTSIRGYAQAIMDGTIPPERQDKYLNVILNESDRLTKLTNDILLLTKMENEVLKPEREDFDLHECIRNILLQFEQKIISKGIHMTLLIEEEDIFVNADYNQINRIITNILDNAIKFCSHDNEITLETSLREEKVVISIKDTGPGISEDDIKHIWTRFHKADRSRGMDKKGVGLGLSIVREIIKAHGETIEVYSQLNKGTTFVFTLALSYPEKKHS
jgi:signal transduction histidine kinase